MEHVPGETLRLWGPRRSRQFPGPSREARGDHGGRPGAASRACERSLEARFLLGKRNSSVHT